ncbi:hypothetical protein KP509_18G063200 [Ceratopteris richardii]|nr:hypothetical protein KP509_18G063200 [Ceratopteris richardii]
MTVYESLSASAIDIKGAVAYAVSGTPADCVSLTLSGVLSPPIKPALVLSGINKGCNCGYHIFYSGTLAGAREAVIVGVPAIALSLDWKRAQSHGTDFDVAASISLPLIKSALHYLENGGFSKDLFLNINIPTVPSDHKGFKVTKQGIARYPVRWLPVSPPGKGSSVPTLEGQTTKSLYDNDTQKDETVLVPDNTSDTDHQKLHFHIDYTLGDKLDMDSDFDFGAVRNEFVAVSPLALVSDDYNEYYSQVAAWVATLNSVGL